ncbi:uncharacterized protein FOMMEDRAFT_132624 [Fomitiporia mediterranea MF3/22]|uniref:uncharacterized protein n=1 Tax=Fomitiporia mediterranea (strain MF3/22) TaxID=694068 RepID=UPI0004409760|nr:uncharacterized protein FOMMEDRAFT_132624 [Fomitiporia mediterranea MF3/22]EJD04668.1 hypothetical protein FOMMEDRAFT_132624 [Fomitiporia mediterranea MF3/22]
MSAQHPHSHPHHEPSRYFSRTAVVAASPQDVVNPRILDASIRDVTERLSNEQKAEVLIHAMNLLKLANPFSHHIVENGVMSCLMAAKIGTPQRVQALLLRGRARMAAGDIGKARQDLHKVLELVPDHAVANSLLSIPSSSSQGTKDSRLWSIESASRRLSPELWRQIASLLPRRDLKTLMQIPHVLSRIAFELVFERVDLHIGVCRLNGEDKNWGDGDQDHPDRPGYRLEKQLAQRTADIVARIVLDPSFAKLIKTVRISAERTDRSQHMAFRTNMLATALPKLIHLKEVIFAGSNEVWNRFAEVLTSTHPRLQSLIIEPEHDSEPVLPHLTHLSQFKIVRDHASHSLGTFLAQNRSTLKKLCLCAYYAAFPAPPAVSFGNLTHLEFVGTVPACADTLEQIFAAGNQLVSLRLNCVLLTGVSDAFRKFPNALPRLKYFGFRALDHLGAKATDPMLFPSIAEFLRSHPDLEKLELDVAGESNQKSFGYDASVLGVLPSLGKLRQLAVTVTKDASPGLFSWIIPRGLLALLLNGVPRRNCEQFMITMRPGLPPNLRYLALLGTEVRDEAHFVDTVLPRSLRLVNISDRFYTIRRRKPNKNDKASKDNIDGYGKLEGLDEWPERRVQLHAEEWLESLGCEDALWDDFAPGSY